MAKPKPIAPKAALAPGAALVKRRHPEWAEQQLRWRWLLDSLEGGERYRQAVYGYDSRQMPVRNLVRHKREYPDLADVAALSAASSFGVGPMPGADPTSSATDDDYELRRARTPIPTFVAETIGDHLDRVFAREVRRDGPDELVAWWADVDGRGTDIDCWLHDTVGPILLALGQIDVLFDHPAAPDGEDVASKADVARLGLGSCVASFILPENLVWWKLDARGKGYAECLVREYPEGGDTPPRIAASFATALGDVANYRHWTAESSTLYDGRGNMIGVAHPHGFGRVPIGRLFFKRKPRCGNVGQPPYEATAERQREYYNRDSELILSDTLQSSPLLQGPDDYVGADGSLSIGPGWLLPKKKNSNGATATYEGFEYVDPPKGAAESIRINKNDLRDAIDRDNATAKPAGMNGGGVVSQSGVSKGFDNERLNNKLSGIADALQGAERVLVEFALTVLGDGPIDPAAPDAVTVEYSKQFDLTDVEDMGAFIESILTVAGDPQAANFPEITAEFLKAMVRQAMPGREDDTYSAWDAEIVAALKKAAVDAEAAKAAALAAAKPPALPPGV